MWAVSVSFVQGHRELQADQEIPTATSSKIPLRAVAAVDGGASRSGGSVPARSAARGWVRQTVTINMAADEIANAAPNRESGMLHFSICLTRQVEARLHARAGEKGGG